MAAGAWAVEIMVLGIGVDCRAWTVSSQPTMVKVAIGGYGFSCSALEIGSCNLIEDYGLR
jgi:hypothetical protein